MTDRPNNLAHEAMEKLEQQARVEERTRMSPHDMDAIRLRAAAFCRQEKTSQTELARMAGVNPSTLSEILKDKYKGAPEKIEEVLARVEAVIKIDEARQRSPGKGEFVSTEVAREVFAVLKHMTTQRDAHMALLYGPSGIGKTMALKAAIAGEFRQAVYLQVNDSCRVPATLYRALLMAVKRRLANVYHSLPRAFEALTGELNSHRLLVIDEAENLRLDAINGLRQLHDATGCPIVLAGRPPLVAKVRKSTKDERIGGSLVGRIDLEWDLTARTRGRGGGKPLFSQQEIIEMLAKFKVRVARDAIRWLTGLANIIALDDSREGCGLRYAMSLFAWAVTANKGRGDISLENLLEINALKQGEEYAGLMESEVESYIAQAG